MRPVLAAAPPGPLGVAVSGGGDSTALLLLLRAWAAGTGRAIAAVTVDHGLRAESAAEAASVAALCARHGIAHEILRWTRPDRGNLQAMARDGRRALIADWASARGMGAVALGHTLDDQAETVLIRLGRGSGVDGLAAMAPVSEADGLPWLRPLLAVRRGTLRDWLRAEGVAWSEDPSNDDPAFARVRARRALGRPRAAGRDARAARGDGGADAPGAGSARGRHPGAGRRDGDGGAAGDVLLARAPIAAAPEEVGLRLLAAALMWVSGARYRPRADGLAPAYDAAVRGTLGRGLTLHGCVLRRAGDGRRRAPRARARRGAGAGHGGTLGRALAPRRDGGRTARRSGDQRAAGGGAVGLRRLAGAGPCPGGAAVHPRAA
jgi:tRNA(Ile)-lysidine synthase